MAMFARWSKSVWLTSVAVAALTPTVSAQTILHGQVELRGGSGVLNLVQHKYTVRTNFDSGTPFILQIEKPKLDLPWPTAPLFGSAIRLHQSTPTFLIDGQPVAEAKPLSASVTKQDAPLVLTPRVAHDEPTFLLDGRKILFGHAALTNHHEGSTFVMDYSGPPASPEHTFTAATVGGALVRRGRQPSEFAPGGAVDGDIIPAQAPSVKSESGELIVNGEIVATQPPSLKSKSGELIVNGEIVATQPPSKQSGDAGSVIDGHKTAVDIRKLQTQLVVRPLSAEPGMWIDGEKIISVKAKLLPQRTLDTTAIASNSAVAASLQPLSESIVSGQLLPIMAPAPAPPVSWDEWYQRFADLVRQPLIDAMLEANSPRGRNTIRVLVTREHRVTVRIEQSANPEFDAAVIRAYESLQGNAELQFPDTSRRSFVNFLTDHSHNDNDDCVDIAVKPLKGDHEQDVDK